MSSRSATRIGMLREARRKFGNLFRSGERLAKNARRVSAYRGERAWPPVTFRSPLDFTLSKCTYKSSRSHAAVYSDAKSRRDNFLFLSLSLSSSLTRIYVSSNAERIHRASRDSKTAAGERERFSRHYGIAFLTAPPRSREARREGGGRGRRALLRQREPKFFNALHFACR